MCETREDAIESVGCENVSIAQEAPKEFYQRPKSIVYQSIRGLFLFSVLIYLSLYLSWRGELEDQFFILAIFLLSLSLTMLLLFSLYKIMMKKRTGIRIFRDYFEYPLLYFWKRTVLFDSLFSLERIYVGKKVFAIVLGKLDGGMIVFEKEKFESFSDFIVFENFITKLVKLNGEKLDATKKICTHENKPQLYLIQFLLTILLVSVLILLVSLSEVEFYSALKLGALSKSVSGFEGVYRIFSAFFVHASFLHMITNLLSFAVLADSLFRLVDTYRFIVTLLFSAIVGAITSLLLSPYEYVVGASGGVFGLFGAYCVVKFTKYLPGMVSQRSNEVVFAIVALQIITEYFIDGIDSYSHAGGFLAGALCMALYLFFAKGQSIYKSNVFEKIVALLLSGAYLWGLATFFTKVYT